MILRCKWCENEFRSKRQKNLCPTCKYYKAIGRINFTLSPSQLDLYGSPKETGGEKMPISKYGPQELASKYPPLLKASDLKQPQTFIVKGVREAELKGEKKMILSFESFEKEWVVNKTNIAALVKRYGDIEPNDLVGKKVTLASVATTFQGKQTDGIRVVG